MSFKQIKGQDKPISILQSYIKNSRLSGGYLFSGPQGVGKKLAALALAKTVNCSEEGLDSCDTCPSCMKIANSQHPDLHIIEAGDSEIKIETIRQLQKDISLRPFEAKKKVFIIDDAHKLTPEASNALLKVLEEPPKQSLIILTSDKANLIFKTIVSRCKTVKFSPLRRQELQRILKDDFGLESSLSHFLAYFSEGRLGSALKMRDSDLFTRKNDFLDEICLNAKPRLDSLPLKTREDIRSFLGILAAWFRDIYLIKVGMPHSELINLDRIKDLLKDMSRFSFMQLNDILDSVSDSLRFLDQNVNTKLLLNDLGVKLWKE